MNEHLNFITVRNKYIEDIKKVLRDRNILDNFRKEPIAFSMKNEPSCDFVNILLQMYMVYESPAELNMLTDKIMKTHIILNNVTHVFVSFNNSEGILVTSHGSEKEKFCASVVFSSKMFIDEE